MSNVVLSMPKEEIQVGIFLGIKILCIKILISKTILVAHTYYCTTVCVVLLSNMITSSQRTFSKKIRNSTKTCSTLCCTKYKGDGVLLSSV